VELVAKDRYNHRESAVFLGSIRYEVLKQVYDSRVSNSDMLIFTELLMACIRLQASNTWQWAQKLMTSNNRRQEFVRMRGPHGKGFAEMAVARVPGSGFETPTAEELPFEDFEVQAVCTVLFCFCPCIFCDCLLIF